VASVAAAAEMEKASGSKVADPFALFFVARMVGILENFKQVEVAPGSAAVPRRAVALARDASGKRRRIDTRRCFLDQNVMFPIVTEIIGVGETVDA
jgi:hypothetical protein